MLNLVNATTDKLQLTTSTTADIHVVVSWVDDLNPGTNPSSTSTDLMTPGRTVTAITSAATTDIAATPASTTVRNLKTISIRNAHASTSNALILVYNNNGTSYKMGAFTLAAGELAIIDDKGVLFVYDVNGAVKAGSVAASDTLAGIQANAVQSDMETGTSVILTVTPGRQHFHPGHPKCWGKVTVSAGTPTLAVSYNTTSITDTATDQLTVTIATDFSSANYACQVSIEAATTSLSATTTSLAVFVRNATLLAGSFIIQACEFDIGAATDPSSWHWICCGDL